MSRVTKALSNFLEEDFSQAHIGLSSGARAHLERFRSFLHSYYVEKFGYWPPPKGSVFSKALCKSMYFDFRGLYDFLVDLDSTDSLQDQKPASGGICVLQNVQAFDHRHKYIPLPHPNPLLPQFSTEPQRSNSQRALMTLKLATRQARTERYISNRDALFAATNSADTAITNAPLVKAYRRFERQCTLRPEEKVSISDGRKVRWMLIYGIIQMLVSVIRAPKEVRDVDSPTYPLCCLVAGTLPWNGGTRALNDYYTESANLTPLIIHAPALSPGSTTGSLDGSASAKPLPLTPQVSIQPDCEGDDYFGHTSLSPSPTFPRVSSMQEPAPTRRRSSVFRNASFRSVKAMSFSSFAGSSLGGARRSSTSLKATPAPPRKFSEILVHGYGNGLNPTVVEPRGTTPFELTTEILPEIVVSEQLLTQTTGPEKKPSLKDNTKRRTCPGRLITPTKSISEESSRTPTLEAFDVDKFHDPPALEDLDSPSDNSNSAPLTPIWSRPTSLTSTTSLDLTASQVDRHASVGTNFSSNSTLIASPVLHPKRTSSTASGINVKRTFSVDSFIAKELGLHDHVSESEVNLYDETVEVYQPSGAPLDKRDSLSSQTSGPQIRQRSLTTQAGAPLSSRDSLSSQISATLSKRHSLSNHLGVTALDTLPSQSASALRKRHTLHVQSGSSLHRDLLPSQAGSQHQKRDVLHSLPSQTLRRKSSVSKNTPKGSLKRSDAVATKNKRRSVRIQEEVGLFDVLRMGPAAIV
jgi:hypothetical protein